jgi:hypothetical protein
MKEMVENLKEVRDRTAQGDMTVLDEFFGIYKFKDGKQYEVPEPAELTEVKHQRDQYDARRKELIRIYERDRKKFQDAQTGLKKALVRLSRIEPRVTNAINIIGWTTYPADAEILRRTMVAVGLILGGEINSEDLRKHGLPAMEEIQTEKQATMAAVAMLRNFVEKVEDDNYGYLGSEAEELLKATEPTECLEMWEETQERLVKSERQCSQYIKSNHESTERAKRLDQDVRSLLWVLRHAYDVTSGTLADEMKGPHIHIDRVRALLAGEV